MRMRALRFLIALTVLPLFASAQDFSRTGWISDLEQLQALPATNYPNLEWHARRGVDLPGIASPARAALDRAQSDGKAHGILERFLSRLGDAHLSIEWDANPP